MTRKFYLVCAIKNAAVQYRKEYFRKDGSRVPIELNVHMIMDNSDRPLYFYAFYTDLTEIIKKEEELNGEKALVELYLDLISYDINNMHQVIRGYLELSEDNMKNNGIVSPDDLAYIRKSIDALDNCSNLIENVNRIKQVRSHEFSFKPIDICPILSGVVDQYSNIPNTIIQTNDYMDGQRFTCANEFLKDIFYNIIGNAIKHSPIDRQLTINIDVDGVVEQGIAYHRIAISDTGAGIPDNLKSLLFNRLQRGKTKAIGKGLGLFLVKTLVESYKGQVLVEDHVPGDPGKGAKFIILLPAIELKKPC